MMSWLCFIFVFEHQTLPLTAASTHTRQLHGSRKLTNTLQAGRPEFIDKVDLLSEVRLGDRKGESEKVLQKRPHCITDIWSWLHCFGTYVLELGLFYLQAVTDLMTYISLIIRCSQDYEGVAWVYYDISFRVVLGNRNWSEVNTTLYLICFALRESHGGTQ